jgi:hypothetical protein
VGDKLPDRTRHLDFDGGRLRVDGELLVADFVESMHRFAAYLDDNKLAPNGKLPTENFREGYRWRLSSQGERQRPRAVLGVLSACVSQSRLPRLPLL